MKFKLLTLAALLSFSLSSFAMEEPDRVVTLPDAETLTTRLRELGLAYLVQKTDFLEQFAGKRKKPECVAEDIKKFLTDYQESINKRGFFIFSSGFTQSSIDMQVTRPYLIQAVLKDTPGVLERLRELKLYTPIV